ncbi:phage tail tape measure protein [Bifidobacterium breve]|uniref:phage tail tape measure protein n=1 Tax=Bifidobacterium breve TaxID=1685 RepID=UPI0022AEB43E|nr:phage tail tape measure protein [Bifidobacterium breve]MCZ4447220.1 phage tail tape measure protein [Bifidobacterium breve]MCZ4456131.1 phage tail tape measure protein [Bifidobacterium breve]MDK7091022.1 phage tail tape measure protein [Bifidobacterium breve]
MAGGLNRNITVRLLADTSNFTAGMAKVSGESQKAATTMEAAGGKSKLITTGIAAAGVAATALGVAAVRMAADFDASMSTVQANTGASADEMNQLRQAAIDAGADTIYSATESADAINELGKAGLSTSDILSGGLSGALNLAASDGMEVGQAAEYMSSAMAQFNLTGADATHIADLLAAGAGEALGNVSDFGEALNNVGSTASKFGLSIDTTVGTLAAFAHQGIIGAEAGTQLRSVLLALTNQTEKQRKATEEYGISLYDAQGNFVGMSSLAGQLKEKLGGLTQEQRNSAMATMFGSYAIQGANVLYAEGASGIDEWTKKVSQSGYAADLAAKKNDNLKGDLENLSGSFESLMISLGEGGQGPLRSLVQTLDTLVDAFSQLPAPVQQGIVLMTALAGGFTALHSAMGPLNASSSQTARNFGLMLDPFQRGITAIPLLKEGIIQLGTSMLGTSTNAGTLANGLTRGQTAMNGMKSIGSGLFAALGGPWGIALTVAGALLVGFAQSAQDAKANISEFSSAIDQSGSSVETLIKKIASGEDKTWDFGDKFATGLGSLGEALDKAGIDYSTFAEAVDGSKKAQALFDKQLDEAKSHMSAMQIDSINDSYGKLSSQVGKAKEQVSKTNTEVAKAKDSADTAAEGTDNYADSADGAATSTEDLTEAIDGLVKGWLSLPGTYLTTDQAITKLNQGILDLNESITENGRVFDEGGNVLQGHEKQAYDSQSALQSLASTAQDTAQKIIEEGQANDRAAAATQQAGDKLEQARQAFIENAHAAGMSEQAAGALADRYGLTRSQADVLRQGIENLSNTAAKGIDVKIKITDDASKALDNVKLKAEKIDDKTVRISGDNTDLMQKIAEATGATIDPKTGKLDLDKTQFDYAMAIAAGATIDPKTGLLQGDNSGMLAKVAEANGWTIDPKTGYIYANDDQAIGVIQGLNNMQIADKWFTIHGKYEDSNGGTYSSSGYRPAGAMGNIPTGKTGGLFNGYGVSMRGYATGGRVVEGLLPGKATTMGGDNITLANARVKSGEFVSNVKSVDYYGADLYAAMNRRQVPRERFYKPNPMVLSQPVTNNQTVNQTIAPVFQQKIVRPADDLYVAGSILHRDAVKTVGRLSRI